MSKHRVPKVGRHSSGQARVTLSGQVHYLGEYGSPEAANRFAQLLQQWELGGRRPLRATATVASVGTMAGLIADYLAHVDGRGKYRMADGRVTSARLRLGRNLNYVAAAIGELQLHRLRPAHMRQAVEALVGRQSLARTTVNKAVARFAAVLQWARGAGRIDKIVLRDLLDELRPFSRDDLPNREHKVQKYVPSADEVAKIAAAAPPVVGAMIRAQFASGARPGEIIAMRWSDLDRRDPEIWTYTVRSEHAKTAHHGKKLVYSVPAVLVRDLVPTGPVGRVFEGAPTTVKGYALALASACRRVGLPRISGHCVRHAAATESARRHGAAVAQALLNHSSLAQTSTYVHARAEDRGRAAADLASLLQAN